MSAMTRRSVLTNASAIPAAALISAVPVSLAESTNDFDPKAPGAVLARAEQVIDFLRSYFVCEGWKIDEAAADRTLKYFRNMPADAQERNIDDDELQASIEFLHRHGQSVDWVFNGSPGGMICRAAARSEQATRIAYTPSTEPDPIFAAIEKHRIAWAAVCSNSARLDELSYAGDEDARRELERLHVIASEAEDAILDVIPTTIAGVIAVLNHAVEFACDGKQWGDGYVDEEATRPFEQENGVQWEVILHRNLAKALRKITEAAAA